MQIGIADDVDAALAVDRTHRDKLIARLAAMRAGIHAQRTADGAGNAAIERKPVNAGIGRRTRDLHVRHRCAGANAHTILDDDFVEAAAQANDNARHAAVAHDEIGAEANDRDRNRRIEMREEISEIIFAFGREQDLRRTAGTKPSERRKLLIGQETTRADQALRL